MKRTPVLTLLALAACLAGCSQAPSVSNSQRVYIWQREWTPDVSAAVRRAAPHVDGFVVLAAQLDRAGKGFREVVPDIDWAALREAGKPVALCVRVSPYPGPFKSDDTAFKDIGAAVSAALDRAEKSGIVVSEVQLDFDCGEKKLAGYAVWLEGFRGIVAPRRAVFTALPYWLNQEKDFSALCAKADGFVLQVHSFALGGLPEDRTLCDVEKAKVWLAKAFRYRKPFDLALPTYTSWVGFGPDGKVIGVVSEASVPQWPEGTRVAAAYSDPSRLSEFVRWLRDRPRDYLNGILWFRLPVSTDRNNWDLPMLARVMAGEPMQARFELASIGQNPVDLSIINAGECDGFVGDLALKSKIPAGDVAFAEPLPAWKFGVEDGFVTVHRSGDRGLFLRAGQSNAIGWLRLTSRVP